MIAQFLYAIWPSVSGYYTLISLLFALLLTLICLELNRLTHWAGVLLFAIFSIRIWTTLASTQFMSEELGILLCATAILIALLGVNRRNSILLLASIHVLAIAELTRPGNIMFPMLAGILMVFVLIRMKNISRLQALIQIFLLFSTYFTLNLIGIITRLKNFMNSGNTWATLYGLTHGNTDWTRAYEVFKGQYSTETDLWRLAKDETIHQFISSPLQTMDAVLSNILRAVPLVLHRLLSVNLLTSQSLFFCFALSIVLFFRIRNMSEAFRRLYLTVALLLILTELLSYGIVLKSDPMRTMSSTLMLDVAIIILIAFRKRTHSTKAIKKDYNTSARTSTKLNTLICFPAFLIIIFVGTDFSPKSLVLSTSQNECVMKGHFQLLPKGQLVKQGRDIDTSNAQLWWSPLVAKYQQGYFLEGFAAKLGGGLTNVNLYIPNNEWIQLNHSKEFCYDLAKDPSPSLDGLGFQMVTTVNP